MNNPKIKVEADLSSFDAEINKLKSQIAQLGDALKTETGKAHFNFDGSRKELNALLAQTDKVTSALEKGDKASRQYVRDIKALQDAMSNAAKVASKLESLGDIKKPQASNYFRNYSGELTEEYHTTNSQHALQREQERFQQQLAHDRHAQQTKWANRAAKFAGFVGGSVMGGGGGYSMLGARLGSMLPGPFGQLGGEIGGIIGGAADRSIGPARQEVLQYSELRRAIGSTSTDFDQLRDSVRSVIHGLGVTDNEAANLAKNFARTASLTGDATRDIARGIGTSSGFAQSYGMSPEQATSFFATMRLTGNSNNDKDSRRLAMMIGESVQKGGTSARMDEVLGAISSFATKSAQQTLTSANVGEFSSYLSSLTGSRYAELRGDPNSSAQLLNMADDAVRSGGTMGEASQFHWLQARQSAFNGMSALDNSIMQGAGLTGDLAAQFAPGSAVYDNASAADKAKMDRTRASIQASGMTTNFKVGMAHIKAISHGDSYLENASFRGMFGGNPLQAAALMMQLQKNGGVGGFENELAKYGVNLNTAKMSQISAYASLISGGDNAQVKQYEKLLDSGKLSVDDMGRADKIMAKEGYGDNFKKLLFELTEKYDIDDGQRSQVTQIEISNKIQEKVSSLVDIETDVKDTLLEILRHFDSGNPIFKKLIDSELASIKDGAKASGRDVFGGMVDMHRAREVDDALMQMRHTSSQDDRINIAKDLHAKIKFNPRGYPAEAAKWLDKAMLSDEKPKHAIVSDNDERPTINLDGSQKTIEQKITEEAIRRGVPPELALGLAMKESTMGQDMVGAKIKSGMHKGDRAYGPFQYMAKSSVGWDRFDIDQNISHGVGDLKHNYEKFGAWDLAIAAHHTGAGREEYLRGELPNTSDGYSTTRDYVNAVNGYAGNFMGKAPQGAVSRGPRGDNRSLMEFTHNIHLRDSGGNLLSDPLIFTHVGAPVAAGT